MASDLVRSGALSDDVQAEVRATAALRNALVHGRTAAPDRAAMERLDALVGQLRREIDERQAA